MTTSQQPGIDITLAAAAILDQERNAYWRPRPPTIRVDAIEFAYPSFLAGPFDGRFGLVYVAHSPDARPMQELLDEVEAKILASRNVVYLPYSAYDRIRARFPQGVSFYWDALTQSSYSELDLPHLPEDIRARLESKDRCGAFANTEAGRADLFRDTTPEEHAQHRQNLVAAIARAHLEMKETERCAEFPYSVRLQGNDDASWTVACDTLTGVELVLAALRQQGYGAVKELMYFTN